MDNEKNPYSTPTNAASVSTLEGNQKSGAVIGPVPPFRDPVGMRLNRLFAYSYMLSLVVGISVAVAWVCLMIMASPQAQMPSSPDILQLAFVFITTLPSVFTCFIFSWVYSSICSKTTQPAIWPALIFGTLSGLLFNAFTAISVIEHFFQW
ncbi:MAG: hypothetical protein ACPHJ3_18960 [Rubripirellula sp.]